METVDITRSNEIECIQHSQMIAHSDFTTCEKSQLSFKRGDTLEILDRTNEFWWWAELDGNYGFVPVNHLCKNEEWASASWQDEEYFGSYGNLKVHHEMLSDKARTKAYMDAIVNNAAELQGKTVLDVGCGTGILSMMCAKYGRVKKVYAVEVSEMAEHTQKVIKQNNLSDQIEVIQDYAENLDLDQPVDLIISEWMGTVLLFEMMVESVIRTRDKHLVSGGTIWPSSASLFLVPCSAYAQYSSKVEFWDSQFGFDFSHLKDMAKSEMLKKPLYDYILPKEDCLSAEQCVLKLDMNIITLQELEENVSDFKFVVTSDETLHGFCSWFEVGFSPLSDQAEVTLNTGPDHELTHWKQDLFILDEPCQVMAGNVLTGTFTLVRNKEWRRHLRVHIEYTVLDNLTSGKQIFQGKKLFHVWR